jgi:hypothetical protein
LLNFKKIERSFQKETLNLFPLSYPMVYSLNSLFSIATCNISHNDDFSKIHYFFSKSGYLFFCSKNETIPWNLHRIGDSFGDVSAAFEEFRDHSSVYFVNQEGTLTHGYFEKSWKIDASPFKNVGKVNGRISSVYEVHRNHSAVFFKVLNYVCYFYKENIWRNQSSIFEKFPCVGDISAVYDKINMKSLLIYEGEDGYIHFWSLQKNSIHKILQQSRPPGLPLKMVHNEFSNQFILITIGESGQMSYCDVNSHKKLTIFGKNAIGDFSACYNPTTKCIEVCCATIQGITLYRIIESKEFIEIYTLESICESTISMCSSGNETRILHFSQNDGNANIHIFSNHGIEQEYSLKNSLFEQEDFVYFIGTPLQE